MFKFLWISFLLFTTSALGQSLEGCMGIKFGSSQDIVKKSMLAKPGCRLSTTLSGKDILIFTNVQFAGHRTIGIHFYFIDGKLHSASVIVQADLESQVIDLYNTIREEINSKYYPTKLYEEKYTSPYEKGDAQTETAIKLGKASFASYWKFKNTAYPSEDMDDCIFLDITKQLYIKIRYQNTFLFKIAYDRLKEKINADY